MRKFLRFAVCAALCILLLTANLCVASAASGFYAKAEMLLMKSHLEADAGLSAYNAIQGACTDGQYAYFACMGGAATVIKYDVNTWEYIDQGKIGNVGHGNDMTYNSDKKYLVVANNAPYYDIVTLVDPKTLSPIEDVKLDLKIYSIAYNAKRRQYVVGISGGYDFALLDEEFKLVKDKKFKGVNTGYTRQGCDCDDNYIYFVQSGGSNLLVIYDYDGKHIADIPLADSDEVENIFHVGNTFYTSMYYYGNFLHRIGFSEATKIAFTVTYDAGRGWGSMDPTTVHYGEATKLRKADFVLDGYFFGGWMIRRSTDGKIAGYRNGSEDCEWLSENEIFNYCLYDDEQSVAYTVRNGGVRATAFWIAERYGIDFLCGAGEGEAMSFTVGHDEAFEVPDGGYTREGYVFDGYAATRDVDGRIYGYRKGSQKAEWLYHQDAARTYNFYPGDTVSALTAEGSVTMTAQYRYAFSFDDDGDTLTEYIGIDERVDIPTNSGRLTAIAQGAFRDNENIRELVIPAGVTAVAKEAVTGCENLRRIYFEGEVPENLDGESILSEDALLLYEIRGGQPFFIGFFSGRQTIPLIRSHAASLSDDLQGHLFG